MAADGPGVPASRAAREALQEGPPSFRRMERGEGVDRHGRVCARSAGRDGVLDNVAPESQGSVFTCSGGQIMNDWDKEQVDPAEVKRAIKVLFDDPSTIV